MSKSIFSAPQFNDETAAYAFVEAHLWADGRVCPHCGVVDKSGALKGKSNRVGLYKCYACRKPFTVKVGTIFEDSHIATRDWLTAIHLICSSKKGISSNQLHRTLGITLKSAWFMAHRIRHAFGVTPGGMFGSGGGDVEIDETFIGRDPDARPTPKHANPSWVEKIKVVSLVDRQSGRARSFVVDTLSAEDLNPILSGNIASEARLLSDEAKRYIGHGKKFRAHGSVNHSKDEYVSFEDPTVHTNTVEGFFSIFKRGMKGVYQHAAKRHMHRYLAEFDFRYSNRVALGIGDEGRAASALKGTVGKRLTYRTTDRQALMGDK